MNSSDAWDPGRSASAGSTPFSRRLLSLFAALNCVCSSFVVGGCEQEQRLSLPTTTELPTRGPARGPRVEDPHFVIEAHPPRVCVADGPLAPAQGFVRVSVPVSVTAKSQRDLIISAFDFSLTNDEGHVHRPTLASCGDPFERSQLGSGETHRGELAFDVRRGAEQFELHFQPFIIGRQDVLARVRVPRPAEAPSPK